MTLFVRYYDQNGYLIQEPMSRMLTLIQNEENRKYISELVYRRLYERFIKIFFYEGQRKKKYSSSSFDESIFEKEYKNGFIMMASACLLIENLSSFLQGNNTTTRPYANSFDEFFKKCKEKKYNNPLKDFHNKGLYKSIRNGLLHQGETYNKYKIGRNGSLYDKSNNKVNAFLFVKYLNDFLLSYKSELNESRWDSKIWDNCRAKIRYIVDNAS